MRLITCMLSLTFAVSTFGRPVFSDDNALPAAKNESKVAHPLSEIKPIVMKDIGQTSDAAVKGCEISLEISKEQPRSDSGIEFALLLKNKSTEALRLLNPVEGIDLTMRTSNGTIVRLPRRSSRFLGAPYGIYAPQDFKLQFVVRGGYINAKTLPAENLRSVVIAVPPLGELRISGSINKIFVPTEKDNPEFPSDGSARDSDLRPIPKGKYRLRVTWSVVNADDLKDRKRVSSSNPNSQDGLEINLGNDAIAEPTAELDVTPGVNVTEAPIAEATPRIVPGQNALNFNAIDMKDHIWNLATLKGKKNVLLTFFPKCFTGGCANHLKSLSDQQIAFDAADTQILAVSVDPAKGEKGQLAFAEYWKLTFPLIPDTDRKLSILYGAAQNATQRSARMSVLIDKKGVVRFIDTDVHVQTHGSDVLQKMHDLGVGR